MQMDTQRHGNAAISHPASGDPVPLHSTDIYVFVEYLVPGGHCVLRYNTEEVKPLSDGAYILVRKTKNKTKKEKNPIKNKVSVVISAKKKKKGG